MDFIKNDCKAVNVAFLTSTQRNSFPQPDDADDIIDYLHLNKKFVPNYHRNFHDNPETPEKFRCLVQKMWHRGFVEEVAETKVSNL